MYLLPPLPIVCTTAGPAKTKRFANHDRRLSVTTVAAVGTGREGGSRKMRPQQEEEECSGCTSIRHAVDEFCKEGGMMRRFQADVEGVFYF